MTETATFRGQEAPRRFDPLFNDAFLRIFGSPDSAPVTRPLLNAVIRSVGLPEVESVESITADAALPGGVACKTPRLDVVIVSGDGRLFDLEAQRRKVDFGAKSMLYAAKLLAENTGKGPDDGYASVPRVVVVMLLEGTEMFPESGQIVSACRMAWDVDGEPVAGPDCITLVVAELDKVRQRYNAGNIEDVLADESLAWLYLLAAGYEHPEEVDRIMGSFPTIEEFAVRYGIAIDDPDLKRAYDNYWLSELEYNSVMNQARKDGRAEGREIGLEEGRAEGRAEGIASMVESLRAAGADEALIAAAADAARGAAQ